MGGSGISRVKENAREIALSSDADRAESLASRELQNILGFGAGDASGTPFTALLRPLSLTAVAATFTMAMGDGDAFAYLPADPSLTVDDSAYEVVRWRGVGALTFANPNGSNPRIDLVVATPAMADTDLTSRTILLDPTARTIAAQNVFKTTNPAAAILVVTGTAAATPAAPAVPSGAIALAEVYVPAAVGDATAFFMIPRAFRRATFPWSTASGIMAGGELRWTLTVDASAAPSTLTMNGPTHRLLIDGELVEWSTLDAITAIADTSNNPFGSAPGSDTPYYIYAVGGRHLPQGTKTTLGFSPVAIIESLTPPDLSTYGRPTASLATPRGTAPAAACVYLGIGYVQAGTTNRKPCVMDDDMVYIVGADSGPISASFSSGAPHILGTLPSRPALSRKVYGSIVLNAANANAEVHLHPDRGDGAGPSPTSIGSGALNVAPVVKSQVASLVAKGNGMVFLNPANGTIWMAGNNIAAADSVTFAAQAYEHRVCRIACG